MFVVPFFPLLPRLVRLAPQTLPCLLHVCARCAWKRETKKILAPRTTRHPRREKTDDETDDDDDDMGGGGEDQAKRETSTTTPRNDSDSVGSSSSPPTNTNVNTNTEYEKLQIIDARLGLLEEDVADLQTSHDVLTTLIVAAPIVLTAVLCCARLFSASLSISGRKND